MSTLTRLILIIVIATVSGGVAYYFSCRPCQTASSCEDETTWLRREFKLTNDQISRIEKLQNDYSPICANHCAAIRSARETLSRQETARPAPAPEAITSARAELARLEKICADATHAHLRQIAAIMSPEQGRRFLDLVAPKVSGHHHQAPFTLQ